MDFGGGGGGDRELQRKVQEINADISLSEKEKAVKRQALFLGGSGAAAAGDEQEKGKGKGKEKQQEQEEELDENLTCCFCLNILDRPVTTPCGHNSCLKCIQKWFGLGNKICPGCRKSLRQDFIQQPRINPLLVQAIRMSRKKKTETSSSKAAPLIQNRDRPDTAFVTERAKRAGLANAASGRIFVTVGQYHFGAIPAENDPERGRGVLVGDGWSDRMECRQWGAHRPHVAGIAGQSNTGAQSVVMSGGYEDDEDHGEWFLYTGSGGRDLSGNRRTNDQSFDQVFTKLNLALLNSCLEGYPVRVIRSHKDKRSAYAPAEGVRYDGLYRIEKCWRKVGLKGFLVCRYLFMRCDNEPAPWTSEETGDKKRELPDIPELRGAKEIRERKKDPAAWDWEQTSENTGVWKWFKPPPVSKESTPSGRKRNAVSKEKELKAKFGCGICKNILKRPLCAPCGHNFCQACLTNHFAGHAENRDRGNGRRLRVQKSQKLCPKCNKDIADFMETPAVNYDMDSVIQKMKASVAEALKQQEENSGDGDNSEVEQGEGEEEEEAEAEVDGEAEVGEAAAELVADDENDKENENEIEDGNQASEGIKAVGVTSNVVCFDAEAAEENVQETKRENTESIATSEVVEIKDVKRGKRKAVANSIARRTRSKKRLQKEEPTVIILDDE